MPTLVSVIIPTYNSACYISDAISSVINQDLKDQEIIVIDDGSTDATPEILETFKGSIKWIRQKNKGPSSARNVGIAYANGKYIVFLDSDDILLPNMLLVQTDYMQAHPEVGLVYSNGYRLKIGSDGKENRVLLTKTGDVQKIPVGTKSIDYFIPRNCFPIHVAMVRKMCVESVGYFDESLSACEDWDLWFRVASQFQVDYLDAIVALYRIRPGSNSTYMLRNIQEYLRVMDKIENSKVFNESSRLIRSEFYYNKAVNSLFIGKDILADQYFKQSLLLNPGHKNSYLGSWLTRHFGIRAVQFYILKRKIFGKNSHSTT